MKKLLCLILPLLAASAQAAGPDFREHLGLQMWSLRFTAKESMPAALDVAKKFGFTELETGDGGSLTMEQFNTEMKARGLVPIGIHIQYDALKKDLAGSIRSAKTIGARYIVVPWVPQGPEGFTEDLAHATAADFNAWGEACNAAGLKFAYHPHGYEFTPSAVGHGETVFDVLMRETKPELVTYEMDVYWAFYGGADPAKLMEKYPTRWSLMHLKDMRIGAPTGLSVGHSPPTDIVPLGTGQIKWAPVLRTAQKVGIKYYFIEEEGTEPLVAIPISLKYLHDLKL
jgi:sugar phosphate isomerase/epimerase